MSRDFSLADMLRAAAASESSSGEPKPTRPVAEDIAALEAASKRYSTSAPFAPGELVTPRTDSTLKGAGNPHVVLQTAHPDVDLSPTQQARVGSLTFGSRPDMRVAYIDGPANSVVPCWVESWMFEPYVAPEQPQPAAEAPASAA